MAQKPKKSVTYTPRPIPEVGFMLLPSILAVFPISKTGWYDGVKSGKYPQPVRLGPRKVAWRVSDIRELIAKAEAGEAP